MESQSMPSNGRGQVLESFWPNRQGDALQACAPCSGWSVVHDLAAFSEGTLSSPGRRRLARHLARCRACKAILASLINDTRPERAIDEQSRSDDDPWIESAAETRGSPAEIGRGSRSLSSRRDAGRLRSLAACSCV
jgi:hypothetical protein